MKDFFKLPAVLTLTAIIAAGALAYVFNVTKPRIDAQKRLVMEQSLKQVLPSANTGVLIPVKKGGKIEYYKGYASPDTTHLAGYIIISSAHGYSSEIEVMVGVDTSWAIQGIKILSQAETPGLGAKITEIKYGEKSPWFQRQFIGKKGGNLAVDKDGGQIKSVTGATISSRAVTRAVNLGIKRLQKLLGKTPSENLQLSLIF
ncbi:MAG: RnfABCDGE type electron transport complex subunit G [Calditrichaeota bacterium]|nr:RnfABCDGE type electron transport complex subunit G [Calditrichota bacterium]